MFQLAANLAIHQRQHQRANPLPHLRNAKRKLRNSALVQSLKLAHRPLEFLRDQYSQYGEGFELKLITGKEYVLFCKPDSIKAIFRADPSELRGGTAYKPVTPMVGDASILHADGDRHAARRKELAPLLSGPKVKEYIEAAESIARTNVGMWTCRNRQTLDPLLDDLVFAIATRILFGRTSSQTLDRLKTELKRSLGPRMSILIGLHAVLAKKNGKPLAGFVRTHQRLVSLLRDIVDETRPNSDGLAHKLFANGAESSGQGFSDILIVLLGIQNGLGGTLKRTLWYVLANPAVHQRLAENLQKGDRQYLKATVKESLRICPSVPFALRTAERDLQINGTKVRKGQVVAACMALSHQNSDAFAQPEEFRPERFIDGSFSSSEYFPFGGGSRRCLGAQLATGLLEGCIAEIVKRFEFTLLDQRPMPMKMNAIFIVPARKIRVNTKLR